MMETDDVNVEVHLKQVLDELSVGCGKYVTISKSSTTGPGTGKTKLDKEHLKLCQREIVNIYFKLLYIFGFNYILVIYFRNILEIWQEIYERL